MSEFNPSLYEGKPRHLSTKHRRALGSLMEAMTEQIALMSDAQQETLRKACLSVSPINCGWQEYEIARIVYWKVERAQQPAAGQGESA